MQRLLHLQFAGIALALPLACSGCGDQNASSPITGPAETQIDVVDRSDAVATAEPGSETVANSENPSAPTATETASDDADQPVDLSFKLPVVGDVYPEVDFTLDAVEFQKEYKSLGSDAWNKKYRNKAVEISGKVLKFRSDEPTLNTGMEMQLEGHPDYFLDVGVQLVEDTPWVRCPPGSVATVRGKVSTSSDVKDAIIVKVEPGDPLPEFTAREFAKRVADDGVGLAQERKGKPIRIHGTMTRRDADYDETGILFVGADAEDLIQIGTRADFPSENYEYRRMRFWKPGDEVEFIGVYIYKDNDELPLIKEVLPISPWPEDPPLPKQEPRNLGGRDRPFLVFPVDELGAWARDDPRKLQRIIDQHAWYSRAETTGEVLSLAPNEYDPDVVDMHLKNAPDARIRCTLEKKVAANLKPGTVVTVRGILEVDGKKADFSQCEVTTQ